MATESRLGTKLQLWWPIWESRWWWGSSVHGLPTTELVEEMRRPMSLTTCTREIFLVYTNTKKSLMLPSKRNPKPQAGVSWWWWAVILLVSSQCWRISWAKNTIPWAMHWSRVSDIVCLLVKVVPSTSSMHNVSFTCYLSLHPVALADMPNQSEIDPAPPQQPATETLFPSGVTTGVGR